MDEDKNVIQKIEVHVFMQAVIYKKEHWAFSKLEKMVKAKRNTL